jgi:hypothetical protein
VLDALHQAAIVDPAFARTSRDMREPDLRHIAGHLRNLDLPGDPLVVATLVTSALQSFATTWLGDSRPGPELSDEEAVETLTSFVWAGIGGRGPSRG